MHPEEKQVKRAVAALALAPAAAAGSGLRQLCTRYPCYDVQEVRPGATPSHAVQITLTRGGGFRLYGRNVMLMVIRVSTGTPWSSVGS